MLRAVKNKLDLSELSRRASRSIDGNFIAYRKLFLLILGTCVFFYIVPFIYRLFFTGPPMKRDPLMQCMDDRLTPYFLQSFEFDANIRHVPPMPSERDFISYVGNGYIGLEVAQDAALNIKFGRSLQLMTPFHPIVSVLQQDDVRRESFVVEYTTGIVHRFECFKNLFVSYAYYAHRKHPGVFMQEIKITNTRNTAEEVEFILPRNDFQEPLTRKVPLGFSSESQKFSECEVITGTVQPKQDDKAKIVISIVKPVFPQKLTLKKRSTISIKYPITIHYSHADEIAQKNIDFTEDKAVQAMEKVLWKLQTEDNTKLLSNSYKQEHISVWSDLWATGFSISTSKAEKSLNGDRINATVYAVLSQVRSYEYEETISGSAPSRQDIAKILTYAEGCYDSYYTLQAENLWQEMDTLANLNNLVSSWILTLEKQGCHNLIRAGASGVIQAMVLSFGSFRFSNQHLECKMHPRNLHRDFHFRRLNYGNMTHVNVTITVTDDNKAVINVALDRSDRSYYACDAGCLDEPKLLTQKPHQFPVKLTEPLYAILYITEDKQHIKELHEAIHVTKVVEAPAHEQHVISLHRHGHQLGGLPTLFWVSVCAIIIVFHIFLCKLIIKEYCEPSEKVRYRYNKP